MKVVYFNDATKGPGYGFLQILEAGLATSLDGVRFSIKRASDRNCLGKSGWQPSEVFLQPRETAIVDGTLVLAVGPEIVDNLDSRENYRLVLLSLDEISIIGSLEVTEVAYSVLRDTNGTGAILAPDEPETHEEGPPVPETPLSQPAPEPASAPDPFSASEQFSEPDPDFAPEPAPASDFASRSAPEGTELSTDPPGYALEQHNAPLPQLKPQTAGSSSRPLLLVLLLVLLAGAGVGGWMYMQSAEPAGNAPPQDVEQPSAGTAPATPSTSASSGETQQAAPRTEQPKPLAKAREHLAGAADPALGVALAKDLRATEGGADAAFLLVEDAAEKGHAEAMLLTASFYDPTDTAPCGSIIKDAEQALFWYKQAAAAGREDATSRLQTLRVWVEAEAAKGSPDARALLKQF